MSEVRKDAKLNLTNAIIWRGTETSNNSNQVRVDIRTQDFWE